MQLLEIMILLRTLSLVTADDQYGKFLLSGSNLEWPSVIDESNDVLYGRYEPRKILVNRIQMDDERAYVSMPRFMKTGVPWTLGTFRLDETDFEPDIRPYPDYSYYGQCDGGTCIVNVIDAYVEGGVLWALDTGTTNVLKKPLRLGPAQLIVIDLATDTVTRAVDLSAVTWPDSSLEYVVAQRTLCDRLYVYVSDASKHAMVVYDEAADRLHTIPLPETISVAHHRHVVLYLMAIGKGGKNYVYFTYRQSVNVFALNSWSNESVTFGSVSEVGAKPVDMHVLGTDRGTNVYFRTTDGTDVWAWDVNRPLDVRNFELVHRSYLYLMPTAVVAGWRNTVWTVESNYDEYVTGNVDCTGPRSLLRPLLNAVDDCDSFNEV